MRSLLLLAVAGLLSPLVTRDAGGGLAPSASGPRAHPPGQLLLKNAAQADSLRLEILLTDAAEAGSSAGEWCGEGLAAGQAETLTLGPGRAWSIRTDRAVCWRRAADVRDPAAGWGAWQLRDLSTGETLEVAL